jgi:hypothetical protein
VRKGIKYQADNLPQTSDYWILKDAHNGKTRYNQKKKYLQVLK